MAITIILAVSKNGVIGKDGGIPWYLPNDFKHFKEVTSGGIVVMGRKTWESLPKKPLPNRENWVISRDPEFIPLGAKVFNNIDRVLLSNQDKNIFVIGGETIYKRALLFADNVEVTIVHKNVEGDRFFNDLTKPNWNIGWELTNIRKFIADETHECPYEFLSFKRKAYIYNKK